MSPEAASTVVVGTGFASSFFLAEYLKHVPRDARILVLERGRRLDPALRLQRRMTFDVPADDVISNRTPQKKWVQNIGFGGGSCWGGQTPRMHPNDFRTRSLYGVGTDWPLSYDELEPYYVRVEEIMGVSGAAIGAYPRSKPYSSPTAQAERGRRAPRRALSRPVHAVAERALEQRRDRARRLLRKRRLLAVSDRREIPGRPPHGACVRGSADHRAA